MSNGKVHAAGGVVWKVDDGTILIVLVHRPKYDDWTLPKGKLEDGESHEQAARREVEEETGYRCKAGHELISVAYRDGRGRPKVVRYWEMTISKGEFAPNDEVDRLQWVTVSDAMKRLSYDHDKPVLDSFADYAKAKGLKHRD